MNLFRYCADDPVNHTDPTGLSAAAVVDRWKYHMLWQGGGDGTVSEQVIRMEQIQAGMGDNAGGGARAGSSENTGELKVHYARYPEKGPGGRPVVDRALGVLRSKPHGKFLLAGKGTLTIQPTDAKHPTGISGIRGALRLRLNPKDALFYDPDTYRKIYRHNLSDRPPISDAGGRQ